MVELAENYKKAYDNRLGFGERPALVLVDFVAAYFDEACPLFAGVDDALASALRVRDAARAVAVPVIYTNVVYQADGADGGVFFRKAPVLKNFIARETPWVGGPPGSSRQPDELVISKQYPSAFFGTSLASTLHHMADRHAANHRL